MAAFNSSSSLPVCSWDSQYAAEVFGSRQQQQQQQQRQQQLFSISMLRGRLVLHKCRFFPVGINVNRKKKQRQKKMYAKSSDVLYPYYGGP